MSMTSRVSPKGQVTIPVEIRERLGISPGDRVCFWLEWQTIRIARVRSFVKDSYQSVPALNPPRSWREMEEIAHEEHALHVAAEGLDDN